MKTSDCKTSIIDIIYINLIGIDYFDLKIFEFHYCYNSIIIYINILQ